MQSIQVENVRPLILIYDIIRHNDILISKGTLLLDILIIIDGETMKNL